MQIGFLGLGNMGGPMALNLIKAGHRLTVYDLVPSALEAAVKQGATAAASVAGVATADVDVIITMLPAAQHVREVYLGGGGILAHVRPGVLLIECSTIDPRAAREIAAAAEHNPMLDAPVSGGTVGAAQGSLTFMVGGTQDTYERALPLLSAMGKNIVHCGENGNGQAAKIANNMLLGISMIGVAEAMRLGVKLGMDAKVLAEVINTSSGRCWSSELYNPFPGVVETAPAARGYSGGFGVDLMLKDLGLANEAARQVKQSVPMGALAQQLYQCFSTQGHGGLDFSAIIQLLGGDT